MRSAVEEYTRAVESVPFIAPVPPLIGNITAAPLADPNAIRAELPAQLTAPVRWTESVRYVLAQGVTTFIELGSKDVLTGLLKRIDASATGIAVGTPEAVANIA